MSAIEKILNELALEIDRMVDRKVEEKLPEMIRALGIREAPEDPIADHFVDAIEIAKILGYDVSTPKATDAARKRVYNLAHQGHIPGYRPTPKRWLFDPIAVRKALKESQNTKAA